jgi:dihydrofolate reductase
MAKLIYSAIASLDGYVEDAHGKFDWAAPDEEVRNFDVDAVRALKQASESNITIGGAELAGHAIAAGLVDECHLLLVPILVGGGKRVWPDSVGGAQLELLDERRFREGVVSVNYRVGV